MAKKRILVVDDEAGITRGLKLNIESGGQYKVETENRGASAALAAREFKPDLIFLDVMMPDKDGGQIAAEIRRDENLRKTPIVFLTAVLSKDEAEAQNGLIGGEPFLAKPVDAEEVLRCIRRYLGE